MRRRTQSGGYTLFEVIIALVVSGVVLSSLFAALIALLRNMQPQNVAVGGETLPTAPSFGAFPSAVRFHQTVTQRVAAARAVYVFGGQHLRLPLIAPQVSVRPLKAMSLPAIPDFTAGLPSDALGFYDAYSSALGSQDTGSAAEDFTIVIVGPHEGALAVTCLVQVRRTNANVSDGVETTPFVIRDVRLWDVETGAQRYAFVEHANATTYVGAVHTWMRYKEGAIAEEGPACVVFPDPWVYAGSRGRADDIPAFSRFSYFLSVSP